MYLFLIVKYILYKMPSLLPSTTTLILGQQLRKHSKFIHFRTASTAKSALQLIIKNKDELLCHKQPDKVINKLYSQDLNWDE